MNKKQLLEIFDQDTNVSVEKYFVSLYGELPNSYIINFFIDLNEFIVSLEEKYGIKKTDFIVKIEEAKKDDFGKINYDRAVYLIKIKEKLLLLISSRKAEIFYSKDTEFKDIEALLSLFTKKEEPEDLNKKFYVLSREEDFSFKAYNLQEVDIDLEEYYNKDFVEKHEEIKNFLLDDKNSGLVILHGKPLTGKTTYLKYLMNHLDKKFVLVPKNKFQDLSAVEFYLFISEYHDTVIVLEDCDQLISSTQKSNPLSEFLNNAEGLFSNSYKYKIICTFTGNERLINYKLLGKAKTIIRYEFEELETDQGNKLRKKLGIEEKLDRKAVLGEILNPRLKTITNKTLGFK